MHHFGWNLEAPYGLLWARGGAPLARGPEPTLSISKIRADGFRKSPLQGHKRHPRLVPYGTQRKSYKVVCYFASDRGCECRGACPHGGKFLRHDLPSRNAQACSSLRLNCKDPINSGCPCRELGNTTASLAPPSNFTHLSRGYCCSFPAGWTPTTSAAKRRF